MTMNTSPAESTTTRVWLSTLWIFVLFNMIFADIYSFTSNTTLVAIRLYR